MTIYNLDQGGLEQLFANTHLAGGVVSAIDSALINSGNYPTGKLTLPVDVVKGSGMETVSVPDTIGLFLETGSNVEDTIKFSPFSTGGHVLVAGDGNSVSLYNSGRGGDTLIAGYQDTLATYQTLSADHGPDLLLGGLNSNAHDTLMGGTGRDTLQVYSGQNVLGCGGPWTRDFGRRIWFRYDEPWRQGIARSCLQRLWNRNNKCRHRRQRHNLRI